MNIAINTRFWHTENNLDGFGYFTKETVLHWVEQKPEHNFYLIYDRKPSVTLSKYKNVQQIVTRPAARHPLQWYYWFAIKLPMVLRKIKADILVSPDSMCCLTGNVPQLMVLHDLSNFHYPKFFPKQHLLFFTTVVPKMVKKANRLATVSQHAKQDISTTYNVPNNKIDVVYSAVKQGFTPLLLKNKQAVKDEYTNGCDYFICTGTITPRKNIINVLKAFSRFKKWNKSNFKLVLAGSVPNNNKEFLKKLETYKYKDDVIVTGYLPLETLQKLTAAAYALVYASYYEGFGVPPLEAMQCGVPAIVADNSSLPEICGEAATYCQADDVETIFKAMQTLYTREDLRSEKIILGLEQTQKYSWQQTADLLWQAVEKTVSN
jgi:glycosyltransferase involved in cell wall biosynthesis